MQEITTLGSRTGIRWWEKGFSWAFLILPVLHDFVGGVWVAFGSVALPLFTIH